MPSRSVAAGPVRAAAAGSRGREAPLEYKAQPAAPGRHGAQGPVDPEGAQGPTGPEGPAAPIDPPEFGFIYNVGPQVVPVEADIVFDANGLLSVV